MYEEVYYTVNIHYFQRGCLIDFEKLTDETIEGLQSQVSALKEALLDLNCGEDDPINVAIEIGKVFKHEVSVVDNALVV